MNFKKFFQDYGCCGGDRDDLSISSTESKKFKKSKTKAFEKLAFQSRYPERRSIQRNENKNEVFSTHWTELDDIPSSSNPPFKTIPDTSEFGESSADVVDVEDYTTKEPIDFESTTIRM